MKGIDELSDFVRGGSWVGDIIWENPMGRSWEG